MKTKLFTLFLALVYVGAMHASTINGTCGDNLTWSLSFQDSTLTITGTGAMSDYNWDSPWSGYREDIKYAIVGEGVTRIGNTAFRDHVHLQECSLPSTLLSIGDEAFCFCFQLMNLVIPESCTTFGSAPFNLVPNISIKDASVLPPYSDARSINGYVEGYFVYANVSKRSLRACSSAASGEITLDDAIEQIEYMAFAQCEDITNIHFGRHLKYIGEWSLNGCIGLEGLQFQEGLLEIASNAFGNCFGLQYVHLPNSLTTLGDFAIGNCPYLRTIHFGESLTSVGAQLFDYCQSLDTIYAPMLTPPILDNTAFAASDLANIICYVPYESLALYQQAPVWKEMNIQPAGDVPEIETEAGEYPVRYYDKSSDEIYSETITLHVPLAPVIEGFTFVKWQASGDLSNGIYLQAVYVADVPTSAPTVYTNPANPIQKLIRNGNVYILTDDKIFTATGQKVR